MITLRGLARLLDVDLNELENAVLRGGLASLDDYNERVTATAEGRQVGKARFQHGDMRITRFAAAAYVERFSSRFPPDHPVRAWLVEAT